VLIGAAIYGTALGGVFHGWGAWLAYAPLLVACHAIPTKKRFWMGWLFGSATNLIIFPWVSHAIQAFGNFPAPLSITLALLLCVWQGLRIAIQMVLASGMGSTHHPWLLQVLAFLVTEALFPLVFPWHLAACLHQFPWLLQIADVGAVPLAGVLPFLGSLLVFDLVRWRFYRNQSQPFPQRQILAFALSLVLCLSYSWYRKRILQAELLTAPLFRIAIVQPNTAMVAKPENSFALLQSQLVLSQQAIKHNPQDGRKVDLILWSEGAFPFPLHEQQLEEEIKPLLPRQSIPVLWGASLASYDQGQLFWKNSALLVNDRKVLGRYDKQELFPFGESVPLSSWFPALRRLPHTWGRTIPGKHQAPIMVSDHPITVLICIEDMLFEPTRSQQQATHGRLLLNLTNDAWFSSEFAQELHLAHAKIRAIELHRYLIRATNSGTSAVIDAWGTTVWKSKNFQVQTQIATVSLLSQSTWFATWGKHLYHILALLTLTLFGMRIFQQRQHSKQS
jgi:apolipoprotein N-acyltransferase